jgi:hypothetical protein
MLGRVHDDVAKQRSKTAACAAKRSSAGEVARG